IAGAVAVAKSRVVITSRTVVALVLATPRATSSRFCCVVLRAAVRRGTKCRAVRVSEAPSGLRGDGACLTDMVVIVRRSAVACKTPDEGTATGAGGGAGRTPDDGYAAGSDGGTTVAFKSGIITGACVTTRSHQGFHGASVTNRCRMPLGLGLYQGG